MSSILSFSPQIPWSAVDCGATFPDTCTYSDWAYTAVKTASVPVNVLGAPAVTASEYGLDVIYVGWGYTEEADSYKLYRASSSNAHIF